MKETKTTVSRIEPVTVSVTETARLLGISRPKVYDLLGDPGFPAFRVGGRILVSVEGLKQWVATQIEKEVVT